MKRLLAVFGGMLLANTAWARARTSPGKKLWRLLPFLLGSAIVASGATAQGPSRAALFDWFEYRGNDPLPQPRANEYANPILMGFYPDPSVTRVGKDFYLVNSTFS